MLIAVNYGTSLFIEFFVAIIALCVVLLIRSI